MDIFGMSLSASAVILLIIVIRIFMKNRISKGAMAGLWLIPAARLLLPPLAGYSGVVTVTEAYPSGDMEIVYEKAGLMQTFDNVMLPSIMLTARLPGFAMCIIGGAAAMTGAVYVINHIRFRRRFACSLPCGYDIAPLKKAFGIRRRVSLRTSELADTPFTYGLFRPVIILPKGAVGDEGIRNILCHELSHIKRLDVLFRAVMAACTAVHWFNPLVWVMASLAARDTELACDEKALIVGRASPEEYAFALIGAEERRCFSQAPCFGGGRLEERVIGIMSRGRVNRAAAPAAAAAVLLAAAAVNVDVIYLPSSEYAEEAVCAACEYGSEAVTEIFYAEEAVCTEAVTYAEGDMTVTVTRSPDSSNIISVVLSK